MSEIKDEQYPIFAYGILRKESWLRWAIEEFELEGILIKPAKILGYVPYHSNGINMIFPVTNKQREKYKVYSEKWNKPNPIFLIVGSIIYFYGKVENIKKLLKYIELMESAYKKTIVTTTDGFECYVYYMDNKYKEHKIINLHGIGLVIYPDTILDTIYLAKNKKYDINQAQATGNEDKYVYDYEMGRIPKDEYEKEMKRLGKKRIDYVG